MHRKLAPLSILLVLCACADDTTAPPVDRARPQFDHVTPPQPPTEIAINNYDVIFHYNGLETFYRGASALFTGGLAYGTSAGDVHIVNTAYGSFDVTEAGIPVAVNAPGAVADHQSATVMTEAPDQSLGPKSPIGIVTTRETFAWAAAPDDDYVIVKYSLTNTTGSTISGLHVGYMADPDFDDVATGANDLNNNIAFYDAATQSARIRSTTGQAQHAIIILDRPVAAYVGWTNGVAPAVFPYRDPTTLSQWWGVVSGALNSTQFGPADVRQFLGASAISIAPGATEVITFALVAGDNAADLSANIQAARAHAAALGGAREGMKALVAVQPGLVQWTARLGFPNGASAAAFDAAAARCGGAPITSYAVSGSNVDVAFDALALDSRIRSGGAMHCAGRLSDGRYFAGTDYPLFDDGTIAVTRLTNFSGNDRSPSYSPDGSQIAFGSARSGGGIFVMPSTGDASGVVQLTVNAADQQPSWHPGGSDIAFSRNGQILRVNVATKVVTPITGTGTVSSDPRYSPDGTRIAYRRGSQLWIMNADGSNPHQLAFGGSANLYPEWNVDGSRIYFTSIGRTSATSEGVYWINPNTGEPATQVTPTEGSQFRFSDLSNDGTRLVFQNGQQLVFQDMQSGLHTIVKLPLGASNQPAQENIEFSLDSKRVLFLGGNAEIYEFTIPVPATPAERAAQLSASVNQLITDGLVSAADGAQLADKLSMVSQMIANGTMNAAINHVDAFINKVNALVNSRRLNHITGAQLTSDALLLEQQLQAAAGG